MTRRVIMDSTAASPLRISVAGVDAATAAFNALIFDGNQPPLRLWGTGYTTVEGMSWNEHLGGQNIREASGIPVVVTPAGTSPVFMTMWRKSGDPFGRVYTPSFQGSANGGQGGGGGAICSNQFIATCFNTGAPGAPDSRPPFNYVNYCVFKNYQ
ncbi:hypothetical protein SAMN05444159_1254 [Bradyrhizobium lablabi]|uniref:Uncharacterized protein n=2 Tax=Bradyrhizobium lablabi TaxID=722472 RepID=A0A1M6LEL3_9BRAD|nr:hypothetical protein SAMN05444159_1254 [Bradyrhizobium lablabi]